MAKFDKVVGKKETFKGYIGNPPSNESEYDTMKADMFSGTAPTWTEVKSEMDNLPDKDALKASAKAKLIAGEPLTEEEADTIVL
ncbi:hypothetical protein [uncultured Mediterranean phage uvMED]|nr:hypothetical protein [uncultured Mediterranean phage uvMED]